MSCWREGNAAPKAQCAPMNIVILDDYQDAVRKLKCAAKLEAYPAKVYTNTVKGIGQLSVRLRDAEILVLIRERTQFPRQLLEKLPKLRMIAQTGRAGPHIDIEACTRLGIAVTEGSGSPHAPAELTWALIMAAIWVWVGLGFWNLRAYAVQFGVFISLFTLIWGFFALRWLQRNKHL